ncbi:MAG: hypothetical protein K0U41_01640 [Gammaproteobacteria bacterium]|nr:hypothetical protein [Gammaproteobacteria bacterium]
MPDKFLQGTTIELRSSRFLRDLGVSADMARDARADVAMGASTDVGLRAAHHQSNQLWPQHSLFITGADD